MADKDFGIAGPGIASILSLIRVRDRPSIQYRSGGRGGSIQALSVGLRQAALAVPEVTSNLTAGHCHFAYPRHLPTPDPATKHILKEDTKDERDPEAHLAIWPTPRTSLVSMIHSFAPLFGHCGDQPDSSSVI